MRDRNISPVRERWEGEYDDSKENSIEKPRDSSKHRSKDRSRSSRSEEKDHRSRDRDRSKGGDVLSREKEGKQSEIEQTTRREGDRDDRDKDRSKDKKRERDRDSDKHKDKERDVKDRKGRGRERDHDGEGEVGKDNERSREKGRGKEKSRDKDKDADRENERDRTKGREMDKEKEKHTDRYREKETERYRDKDATEKEKGGNERTREKAREAGQDKDRSRDENVGQKHREKGSNRSDEVGRHDQEDLALAYGHEKEPKQLGNGSHREDETNFSKHQQYEGISSESHPARDLELRISRMREERLQKSEGASEILSWVSKSRKIGEKRMSEKAKKLSRSFEEQDDINQGGRGDDEAVGQHSAGELGGLKVLHGLDKVIEGGAVVLTLKDQSILADGDINQEIDMLENVEIGEQKRRDDAYKAAKKKNDVNDDKFNIELNTERRILPKYDDPVGDEGITLDASGGFSGDAEKKLDELRKRINGVSTNDRFEDLNSLGTVTSDYYTHEEMLQFKKPKKKKSLRKKEKLDIDALEADAVSTGLSTGDLGSRNEGKRQAMKIEQEKSEAEMRSNAYKTAYAKAEEASKALRLDQTLTMKIEDYDNPVFDDDDDDLRKSLAKARNLALKNRDETVPSGPKAIALLASSTVNNSTADDQNPSPGEVEENKVVFTEMEEFVWGLQLDNDAHKADGEDVFMEEDVAPEPVGEEKEVNGGWTEVKDNEEEPAASEDKDKIVPDETIHEVAVGKGLSGALKLLKDRGSLKETVEWGGRNMDKKKSKLVGIYDNDGQNAQREINIERTDEYGRILTPKEAFRLLSHKFHGKGPGKMKQEKRMRQYQEDMKVKQMKNSDTPSQSAERMREAQVQLKTPYLVLSGNVKPGQTSDPRSGFATVENFPGGLTPMLGDRKVEHFLGIKRKAEHGDMGPPPPKPKK